MIMKNKLIFAWSKASVEGPGQLCSYSLSKHQWGGSFDPSEEKVCVTLQFRLENSPIVENEAEDAQQQKNGMVLCRVWP